MKDLGQISVIIADDHPLYRDALGHALSGMEMACELHTAANLDDVKSRLSKLENVDLILLDLSMPGITGFSGLVELRSSYPGVAVVVVSATEDATTIRGCIELGASGFIPKSSGTELIRSAVEQVLAGGIFVPPNLEQESQEDPEAVALFQKIKSLTPQQARVLSMLGDGLLNKQIAYELGVSEATVKAHVSAVLLKLGVDSRTQAVIVMNKIGLGTVAPVNP